MTESRKQDYFHTMDDYIRKTPAALLRLLEDRKEILRETLMLLRPDVKEIILLGSGSSYTAALSAKYYLQEMTGKRITLLYPNNVLRYEKLCKEDALVIGISQSGNSVAAIEAVKKLKRDGYATAALTADPGSQMAESADALLDLTIGNESCGPKTLGYSATLFLLLLLGLEYAKKEQRITEERYAKELEDINATLEAMPLVREDIAAWYRENRERMIAVQKISCVGYGANYGTALEGSLKLIETVRCPAFGYEFEEFLHGPNDGIDKNSTIFLLGSKEEELDRMKRLLTFANGITKECFLFTADPSGLQNEVPVRFVDAGAFTPLEYVIVLQYLAYAISKDRAVDLNRIKYPEYYTIMNCKTKL